VADRVSTGEHHDATEVRGLKVDPRAIDSENGARSLFSSDMGVAFGACRHIVRPIRMEVDASKIP
jgi:hypothetical protein